MRKMPINSAPSWNQMTFKWNCLSINFSLKRRSLWIPYWTWLICPIKVNFHLIVPVSFLLVIFRENFPTVMENRIGAIMMKLIFLSSIYTIIFNLFGEIEASCQTHTQQLFSNVIFNDMTAQSKSCSGFLALILSSSSFFSNLYGSEQGCFTQMIAHLVKNT